MVMPDFEETNRIMREAGWRKIDGVWRSPETKKVVRKKRWNPLFRERQ
jgi:hypothetical protein